MRFLVVFLAVLSMVLLTTTIWLYALLKNERADHEWTRTMSVIQSAGWSAKMDLCSGRLRKYEIVESETNAGTKYDGVWEITPYNIFRVMADDRERVRRIYEKHNVFIEDYYDRPEREVWRIYLLMKEARDTGRFVPGDDIK